FSSDDLPVIEAKMKELAKTRSTFNRREVSKAEAVDYFTRKGDEYKLELIEGLEDGTITFYTQGNFTDLCRGPHLPETGLIKAVKLTAVAGAYWRGDESRPQLTRIYGISVPKQGEADGDMSVQEDDGERGPRRLCGQPIKLSASPAQPGGVPIRFAGHADQGLAVLAGYGQARIAQRHDAGVLPCAAS